MVTPLAIFAAFLATGFLLPLADKLGRRVSATLFWALLAGFAGLAAYYLASFVAAPGTLEIYTGGFEPPLVIALRLGLEESAALAAVAAVALLAAFSMRKALHEAPVSGMMTFLMLVMGLSGLVLTRDLFNLFVFLEISGIAGYALLGFDDRRLAMSAAFKYMVAGGIASAAYLVGVIYLYRLTGTLNLDLMIGSAGLEGAAGAAAVFFVLAALLVELKPFPANGWAIDAYEAANPGLGALFSGAQATAMLFALYKVFPLLSDAHLAVVMWAGIVTFAFSNLVGLRQTATRRMFGYSSAGQVGFVAAALAFGARYVEGSDFAWLVAGGLLVNHLLAKTGLFLLSAAFESDGDGSMKGRPGTLVAAAAGVLVAALVGLPPFPAFWAKWDLVRVALATREYAFVALVGAGGLFEAWYLFSWLVRLVKGGADETPEAAPVPVLRVGADGVGPVLAALGIAALGGLSAWTRGFTDPLFWAPLAGGLLFLALDRLPGKLKALLATAAIAAFGYFALPSMSEFQKLFALMILGGGALHAFAGGYLTGRRAGHFPLYVMTVLSLGYALVAESALGFFMAWELMALGGYFLVLQGAKGRSASMIYLAFSIGGAFLMMAGLQLGGGLIGGAAPSPAALALVGLGLLAKLGAFGLHVWLPGAYAEAADDFSSFFSASLSKVAVFALMAALAVFGEALPGGELAWRVVGWVGILGAVLGALAAIFQEDAKYALAFSSMGQMGYVLAALAMRDQMGWTTALYLAATHFLYKGMMWLSVAGASLRTGTRTMYLMGGLIKRMPISFVSFLVGIIALSGVPPLTGFGGKWLLYHSLIAKGWYFEAAASFLASGIAFLYLYRMIHSIFLGQPKDEHRTVKEAPFWLVLPQLLLLVAVIAFSVFPRLILDPIMAVVGARYPAAGFAFEGQTLVSSLGYWNGLLTIVVVVVVFVLTFIWMVMNLRKPRLVKQFNIVFAAERPFRPETTHFAFDFFAPYRRALGFLVRGRSEKAWTAVAGLATSVAGAIRRLYTGNGQTYALHVVLYVGILYLFLGVR